KEPARVPSATFLVTGAGSDGRRNTIQCVESTMLPGRSDLFGCARSKPSQGSVPADLTLASDLAFVFNASRVRLECCIDLLRPPSFCGNSENKFKTWLVLQGGNC